MCNLLFPIQPIDWNYWTSKFSVDSSVKPIDWAIPGTSGGLTTLHTFIYEKLSKYADCRNDPTKNCLSDLSPWFHYGNCYLICHNSYYDEYAPLYFSVILTQQDDVRRRHTLSILHHHRSYVLLEVHTLDSYADSSTNDFSFIDMFRLSY